MKITYQRPYRHERDNKKNCQRVKWGYFVFNFKPYTALKLFLQILTSILTIVLNANLKIIA